MANRVFLINCDSGDPSAPYDEKDELVLAANYMLPILWCGLYSHGDICTRHDQWTDGVGNTQTASYPVLLTTTATAIQRAADRKALFFSRFPLTLERVYEQWLELLDGLAAPHLRVNTGELWAMMEPEQFDEFIVKCVRAFEENRADDWVVLAG